MSSTLRWAFSTWLALVALQALTTKAAPGRVADLFRDVDRLLERALDPTVPAIPDLRGGASSSGAQVAGDPAAIDPTGRHGGTTTTTTPRLPVIGGAARAL